MAKYTFVVLTNSVEGKDAEFNDWYTNRHLADVLDIPGMVAAQRFKSVGPPFEGGQSWQYFSSYEMETDDPMAVLAELRLRAGTDQMKTSDALHSVYYALTYEPITPRVVTKNVAGSRASTR